MPKGLLLLVVLLSLSLPSSVFANPKLYVFDCGVIGLNDVAAFGLTNQETAVRELFVPCYLVEQNNQYLFWDGGLPIGLAGGEPQTDAGMTLSYQRSVIDQLADMEITPVHIDYVAFSHMHFDHVGAANAFTQSTLLINEAEHNAAFLEIENYPIFNKTLYADLAASEKVLLNDEHDVFGDGSTIIVPAPGHTPGHQVLLVNLENTGPVVLSGDLYHFEFSRRMRRTPDFNTDKQQTLESMAKVEQLLERTGAILWIEHNKALADTLNKAPAYYD